MAHCANEYTPLSVRQATRYLKPVEHYANDRTPPSGRQATRCLKPWAYCANDRPPPCVRQERQHRKSSGNASFQQTVILLSKSIQIM